MFKYKLENLKINDHIRSTFNDLPEDKYLYGTEKYRQRRYLSGRCNNNLIQWEESKQEFTQSVAVNQYLGDVKRVYEPLQKAVKEYIETEIFPKILNNLPKKNYRFGAHQIRILADDHLTGKPCPEGIHQDGFDYIAVLCVDLHNVTGGDSFLFECQNRQNAIYEKVLIPGEILFFDDKKYAHYASPVVPKLPGSAHRDVLVITLQALVETNAA